MRSTRSSDGTADEPLLASRLRIPAAPAGLVLRPRLFSLLDEACTVTVVQAPAGWGKTVLLASWLRASAPPNPVGWLSVERGDGAADFWRHLCGTLQRAAPTGHFPRPDGLPDRRYLTRLTHAFVELPEPLVLVIDGSDHLGASGVEQDLDFLLQHAEGKLRLIAACRGVPPIPVHLWRLRGDLIEVGAAQLGFTRSETADMLARQGVELTEDQVELVQRRSEGWPAGLRLTAAATRHDPARAPGRASDADPYMAEYLTREVLADQPEHLYALLLDTAVVPRMCAGLIEALTGRAHGDRLLKDLVGASLFLVPLDAAPGWYRYRPLFAQVMRAELERREPARIAGLHRRAASWFIEHGLPLDALHHAIAAQDWSVAKRILVDHWCELIGFDYPPVCESAPAPSNVPLTDPEIVLACALERLSRCEPDDAARLLRLADQPIAGLPAERRHRLQVVAAALDLTCARQRGVPPDQQAAALWMLDLLASGSTEPCDEPAQAIALTALGQAQLGLGELDNAAVALGNGLAFAARSRLPGPQLVAASALAVVQALRGELHAAERTAHTALGMPAGLGRRGIEDAQAHLALAIAYLQWDRLDQATAEIRFALGATGRATDPGMATSIAIVCAEVMRQRGELAEGMDVVRSARHEMGAWSVPQHLLHWLDATEADLSSAHGDGAAARLVLLAVPPTGDVDSARRAVALARTYLCDGDPVSAAAAVAPWTDAGVDAGCLVSVRLDTALLRAVAAHRLGDVRGSTRALERVLQLAEPDGFRRIFSAGGAEVHEMLLAHLDSGTAYWSLVTSLVAAGQASSNPDGGVQLYEPLSDRELTVLRYLQSILSNAEIAADMSISVNTVKTHVRNIYRKLDADTRRDAVRRARSLQLL